MKISAARYVLDLQQNKEIVVLNPYMVIHGTTRWRQLASLYIITEGKGSLSSLCSPLFSALILLALLGICLFAGTNKCCYTTKWLAGSACRSYTGGLPVWFRSIACAALQMPLEHFNYYRHIIRHKWPFRGFYLCSLGSCTRDTGLLNYRASVFWSG
jgi:hypothetical protein